MNRVPIGDLVDSDMRLYRFERTSGLPRDYFERRWPVDTIVLIASIACGVAAILIVAYL